MVTGTPAGASLMADQIYLSCWMRGFSAMNMLRHFEKLLGVFPLSRLARNPFTLKITAVNFTEPALIEVPFEQPLQISAVIAAAKDFQNADCCYQFDAAWDLWDYDGAEWKVGPARASLFCFGPDFDNEDGENLRIELGVDALFLPHPELPGSARMTESNIRSLLRLAHDIDDKLQVERRQLWTESGENFAERLQQALSEAV